MEKNNDIAARVKNGATFLDAHVVGWVDKIDLDTLHLGWCSRCMLGQLFDGYRDGIRKLGMSIFGDERKLIALGFEVDRSNHIEDAYRSLTAAWRDLILARRAAAKSATEQPAETVAV